MSTQENLQNKCRSCRKMLLFMCPLWILTVLFAWVSVIASTNVIIGSNVFAASALDFVTSLLDICVYAVAVAFLASSLIKGSGLLASCIIFTLGSALRYLAAAVLSGITLGAVSITDLISALVAFLLDMILMTVMLLITRVIKKRSAAKDACEPAEKKKVRKFIPDMSSAIDKSVFAAAVMWAAVKLLSLIAYDVSYVIFIGKLTLGNILWMVIYYLFAILICPVFYLIATKILKYID